MAILIASGRVRPWPTRMLHLRRDEMFPEGRTQDEFIGLNKMHPLKQGAGTTAKTHRRNICERAGWFCACCKIDFSSQKDSSKQSFRLAADIFFPVDDVTILCRVCAKAWQKMEVQDLETAHAFLKNPPSNQRRRNIIQFEAQGGLCAYCDSVVRNNRSIGKLPGHEGEVVCSPCVGAQDYFLKHKLNSSTEEIEDWIADRKTSAALKPKVVEAQIRSCFTCGSDIKVVNWCMNLAGYQDKRMCAPCKSTADGDKKNGSVKTPGAFIKARMKNREKSRRMTGYTATADGNGSHCPCCFGVDHLNGNLCQIDENEDVWACDECVQAWPDNDERTMSTWIDFAVERKLASATPADQLNQPRVYPFTCPTCGKGFDVKNYLTTHMRRTHGAAPKAGIKEIPVAGPDGMFHCHNCPHSYKKDEGLLDHRKKNKNGCTRRNRSEIGQQEGYARKVKNASNAPLAGQAASLDKSPPDKA